MEEKIAHLEFIQEVIKRMSTISFLIKGWSIALVSTLFAIAAKDARPAFVLLAYFPTVMLWSLDAYYLRQERMFKKLYDDARHPTSGIEVFSMDVSGYRGVVDSLGKTMFSSTLLLFHGCIFLAVTFVSLILMITT